MQRLNDLFYGSGGAADAAEDVDASTQPLNALALWRVQWNALPGERQVYNVHVPHYTSLFEKLVRGPKPWYRRPRQKATATPRPGSVGTSGTCSCQVARKT